MTGRMHLNEVLEQMRSEEPFDVTVCNCDEQRKRGGEIVEYTGVTLHGVDYSNSIRRIMLPGGRIREIHIRLIMFFNGAKVFY